MAIVFTNGPNWKEGEKKERANNWRVAYHFGLTLSSCCRKWSAVNVYLAKQLGNQVPSLFMQKIASQHSRCQLWNSWETIGALAGRPVDIKEPSAVPICAQLQEKSKTAWRSRWVATCRYVDDIYFNIFLRQAMFLLSSFVIGMLQMNAAYFVDQEDFLASKFWMFNSRIQLDLLYLPMQNWILTLRISQWSFPITSDRQL